MYKAKKILFSLLLLICVSALLFSCNTRKDTDGNDVAYADIESVTVDTGSTEFGFMLSSFDISQVMLIVKYREDSATGLQMKQNQDQEAEKNGVSVGEYDYTVRVNASADMIKAEDVKKLRSAGSKTITLIYGKFEVSFVLTLIDDTESKLYKVFFYDEDETTLLSEMQYVSQGGRAVAPPLNAKAGFDFIGWKNKKTGKIETYDNILSDVDFVAVFLPSVTKVDFSVRYRYIGQDGEVAYDDPNIVLASVDVPRGQNVAAFYPEPTELSGYTFSGWSSETIGGETVYYAIYDKNTYDITFIYRPFNEGTSRYSDSLSVKKVGYYADSLTIIEPEDAHCEGISPSNDYQFIGWYVLHEGRRVNVSFPYTMSSVSETCFYGNYVDINAGSSGLRYKLTGDETCAVSGYESDEKILVIPEKTTVDGKICTVTGIDDGVFKNAAILEYVVSTENEHFAVKDGVLYSKNFDVLFAYPSASAAERFTVHSGTREISPYAFYKAVNLTNIELPENLVQIDDFSFADCTSLVEVVIPANVTIIEEGAFRMMSDCSVTSLAFAGTKLVEVGDESFYGFNLLTELTLPASVREIGDGAFYGMTSLMRVTADNNSYFTVYNGALYSFDHKEIILYPAKYDRIENPEIVLHPDCQTIKRGAFYNAQIACVSLLSPCSLEAYSIVCPSLDAVRFATNEFVLNEESFEQAFGGFLPTKIYVTEGDDTFEPYKDRVHYYTVRNWQGYKDFSLSGYIYSETENTITILGYNGTDTDLFIPNMYNEKRIVAIAPYAFYSNKKITSVTLPIMIESIGEYAFYGCTSLNTVSLSVVAGSSLSSIGDYAFYGCTSLTLVYFEESLEIERFGKFVFDKTPFLEKDTDYIIVGGVLIRYSGLDPEIVIPANVCYIATDAFKDVGFVTSITFAPRSKLKHVDEYAFQNCIGLREISFPATLRGVSDYAFYGCKYLFSVVFASPKSDVEVGYFAYKEAGTYYTEFSRLYETFSDSPQYTLTFQASASESYYSKGNAFVTPYALQETNDIFLGWYADQFFTQKVVFPLHIDRDTTIYARYSSSSYLSDGLVYENNDEGNYSISAYNGTDGYVIIPETYKYLPITGVKGNVFGKNVNYVQLPSGINRIEENAFVKSEWYQSYPGDFVVYNNNILVGYKGNAKEVHIPSGITIVADGVFRNNLSMEKVYLPDGLTKIVNNMFNGCTQLKSITIGRNITTIGEKAFYGCSSLEDIEVEPGSKLSDIAAHAFDGTKWIESQTDDCIVINNIFYKYCGNSTELHVSDGIASIASEAFADNIRLRTVYFSTSVQAVYPNAFRNCAISELKLPAEGSHLTYILDHAFYQCYNLSDFDFSRAKNLAEINDYAFYGCSSLGDVVLVPSLARMGEYAFANSGVKTVTFVAGSSLRILSKGAFSKSYYLSSVVFEGGSNLDTIEDRAFYECVSLDSYVNLVANTTSIGNEAFYNCKSLARFDIHALSLRSIGMDAFYNVGNNVFDSASQNNMTILGNILLNYHGSEQRVTIPANIVLIYNRAFAGNTHLIQVDFASQNNLATINDEAFRNCSNLMYITFPDSVVSVGDDVMTGTAWYNEKLRNADYITIGRTLVKYNVKLLTDAEIPENVATINKGAFSGMSVYDIKIGENVKLIKKGAFDGIVKAEWKEGDNVCSGYTITLNNVEPPRLEYEELLDNCYKIYVNDEDILDTYRLDTDWNTQFVRISVIKKYTLNYSVVVTEGNVIEPETLHALYGAKNVTTISTARKQFEFVGWFVDSEYFNAVTYPLVLTHDMTIYAKCVDYSIGSNPTSYDLDLIDGKDEYTILGYTDTNDKKVVIITEQSQRKIKSITGSLGYIKSDNHMYYSLGTAVSDDTYIHINDVISGEEYYAAASGSYLDNRDYYYRKEIKVTANLVGTSIPDGVYSPGKGGYLYEITANSWCSDKYTDRLNMLSVEYCDCDPFGALVHKTVTGEDSEMPELLTEHGAGAMVADNIIVSVDTVADNFKNLIFDTETEDVRVEIKTSEKFDPEEGSDAYTDYEKFFNSIRTLFNNSNNSVARNLDYDLSAGAVIGLNRDNMIYTADNDSRNYDGYRSVVSRMFGYSDVTLFEDTASRLKDMYRRNSAGATASSGNVSDRLKYDGVILASNGYYLMPFAFDSNLDSIDTVLGCVIIDTLGGISIWVNNLGAAINASNIMERDYGSVIPKIDIYGRCKLFRTGKEKYVDGNKYYELVKKEVGDLYILNPDNGPDDLPEYVLYDKKIHKANNYVYYRRNTLIEEIAFANNCTIEELGENCFAGMTSLKKITLPSSLKKIDSNAFADCTSLEEIVFSDGISDVVIKKYAFKGCTSLVDLTVPEGIKTLESYAFIECSSLVNIYAEASRPYDLQDAEPFDYNEELRILVRSGDYNNYYSAWSKYKDYLVVREDN